MEFSKSEIVLDEVLRFWNTSALFLFTNAMLGRTSRGAQPVAFGPHAAQVGCECGPSQNHKFT